MVPDVKWLAEKYLKWRGWEFTGEIPDIPKFVAAGAPHTTNWDFFIFLAALRHYQIKVSFIGKHTLFRWPLGYLMRRWGGIPVDRSRPGGLVKQVVAAVEQADRMILVMAPEGTRKAAPYWKEGFLHIARAAGVPILLAYVDYPNRRAGFGPLITELDDTTEVMDQLRSFFADKQGRHPDGKGPVRLRSEQRTRS